VRGKDLLLQQKKFLVGEINHRVQNSLAIVSGFLSLQARDANDISLRGGLKEAGRRITAIGLVHCRLYRNNPRWWMPAATAKNFAPTHSPSWGRIGHSTFR
jgi:two-component sensor histidine kinase